MNVSYSFYDGSRDGARGKLWVTITNAQAGQYYLYVYDGSEYYWKKSDKITYYEGSTEVKVLSNYFDSICSGTSNNYHMYIVADDYGAKVLPSAFDEEDVVNVQDVIFYNYSVTYSAEGAYSSTIPETERKTTTEELYTFTLATSPVPVKAGYTFNYWVGSSSSGSKITKLVCGKNNPDRTAYAYFTVNTYAITITAETGGTLTGDKSSSYSYGKKLNLNCSANSGYKFKNWQIKYTSESEYQELSTNQQCEYTVVSSASIKCTFTKYYTVKATATTGGSVTIDGASVSSKTVEAGSNVTLKAIPGDYYNFGSWSGSISSTAPTYTISSINKDYTVIATFTNKPSYTYTIYYNNNNSTGTIITKSKTSYDTPYTYQLDDYTTPTWKYHLFWGWGLYEEATKTEVVNEVSLSSSSKSKSVYAVWTQQEYLVLVGVNDTKMGKFNPAGPDATNVYAGSSWKLSSNTLSFTNTDSYSCQYTPVANTGYSFKSWNETTQSGVFENDRIFTATFKPNRYKVTFDRNGGTVVEGSSLNARWVNFGEAYKYNYTETGETPVEEPLPVVTKPYNTFKGWALEDGTIVTDDTLVSTASSHKLTAVFEATKYKVQFETDYGVFAELTLDNTQQTPSIEVPTSYIPTRENYFFIGWNTKLPKDQVLEDEETLSGTTFQTGDTITYSEGLFGTATTLVLYAKWRKDTAIKAYANGLKRVKESFVYVDGEWKAVEKWWAYDGSGWKEMI